MTNTALYCAACDVGRIRGCLLGSSDGLVAATERCCGSDKPMIEARRREGCSSALDPPVRSSLYSWCRPCRLIRTSAVSWVGTRSSRPCATLCSRSAWLPAALRPQRRQLGLKLTFESRKVTSAATRCDIVFRDTLATFVCGLPFCLAQLPLTLPPDNGAAIVLVCGRERAFRASSREGSSHGSSPGIDEGSGPPRVSCSADRIRERRFATRPPGARHL